MDFNLSRIARNMTRNLFGTDIVANNLANVGTTAFKRDSAFTDWFTEAVNEGGAQKFTDFSQGELKQTDNPLDLALSTRGFFLLETGAGPALTRNGHFQVDEEGFIHTPQGYRLGGEHGPLSVLDAEGLLGDVKITRNGEVYVDDVPVDHLVIADVADIRALEKLGDNVYRVTNEALIQQIEPERIDVRQGMLEGSNVQPVSEMVRLIEMQRNFESTQRVVRAMDNVLGRATQLSDYR